jgi:hypothetical protein
MIMATKDAFGVAIRILVTSELPHDDSLVYANAYLSGKTPILDEGYVTSRGG